MGVYCNNIDLHGASVKYASGSESVMVRISPLVTLVVGYILGYVLYPILQAWTCSCYYYEDLDLTAHAQSLVTRREALIQNEAKVKDGSFYGDREQAYRPVKYASWKQLFSSRTQRREPAHLSSEYKVRGRIYIAIITTEKYLATRAKAIHETWARDIDSANKLVFYVGADCNISYPKLPIVRLKNVPDSVYPPQRKVFAALQHMYHYHGNNYQWFVRADDDVYIRVGRLDRLLGRLDPNEKIYLGRSGVGKKQDIQRLQLKSHEHYCMGGPGVVLSRATLIAVAPYLDKCLEVVEAHNRIRKGMAGGVWFNEDVELGRCISRSVGIQCSNSEEVRSNDYNVQHKDIYTVEPSISDSL